LHGVRGPSPKIQFRLLNPEYKGRNKRYTKKVGWTTGMTWLRNVGKKGLDAFQQEMKVGKKERKKRRGRSYQRVQEGRYGHGSFLEVEQISKEE